MNTVYLPENVDPWQLRCKAMELRELAKRLRAAGVLYHEEGLVRWSLRQIERMADRCDVEAKHLEANPRERKRRSAAQSRAWRKEFS